jgi:hypothetical protein
MVRGKSIIKGDRMPLVVDQLQLWTIGFKWAGRDPDRPWLRIPPDVRDNFSTLLEAILSEHLECMTLASEKYTGDDPEVAKCYIRYWLDDVNAAINGAHYNRKLLKWAVVDRGAFQDWCERRSIPLPEFWFPPGWTDYRWPEYDQPELAPAVAAPDPILNEAAGIEQASEASPAPLSAELPPKELRDNQIARIASQHIARVIWKDEPDKTIAAMCKDERVLRYGGAQYYAEPVVRRWIKVVAPRRSQRQKGTPKKKSSTKDE